MALSLQTLHEGLLDCPVALGALSKKLGTSRRQLQMLLNFSLGITKAPPLVLFELHVDVLVPVLDYLLLKDIVRLEIAVSELSMRKTFRTLIDYHNGCYYFPSKLRDGYIKWIVAHGIRIRNVSIDSSSPEVPLETLLLFQEHQFDRLKSIYITLSRHDPLPVSMEPTLKLLRKIAATSRLIDEVQIEDSHMSQYFIANILSMNPGIRDLTLFAGFTREVAPSIYTFRDIFKHCAQLQKFTMYGSYFVPSIGLSPVVAPIPSLTTVTFAHHEEDTAEESLGLALLKDLIDIAPNLATLCISDLYLSEEMCSYSISCASVRS